MKVDPATHIFVLKDTKLEVKDTTNKIIGRVNEDPTYIKSSLNLWEKICRWTFGLFGNYWEEIPVVVETKKGPELKAMYIFKKAFPDISLNEKEPIKAEKTQPSRQTTPQHVIEAAKRRAAARHQILHGKAPEKKQAVVPEIPVKKTTPSLKEFIDNTMNYKSLKIENLDKSVLRKTLCSIFTLDNSVDEKTLKDNIKSLRLKLHPDKNKNAEANEAFKVFNPIASRYLEL